MGGQTGTPTTLLRMETGQHVSISLKTEAQGHTFQSTIHSPAWMDLAYRSRGHGSVSGKVLHTLHWDLLSMAIFQVKPILRLFDTYLTPLNSHRVQDAPLNNLDEVHKWMQVHRLEDMDDKQNGNLEFLCNLSTPSPERMKYLLDLCKEKRTVHLRRTLLETQDLLRIPLSFWVGVSHQTDRGGWWVRALFEELTSGEMRQVQTNLASHPVGQGRMHRLQSEHTSEADLAQKEKGGKNQASADTGPRDALGSSRRNRENIPTQSHFRLHTHIVPHSTLSGGHDARNGYIGG